MRAEPALLAIESTPHSCSRSHLDVRDLLVPAIGLSRSWVLREDKTANNSHDVRLISNAEVAPGHYRLRFAARGIGRRQLAVQLHWQWEDALFWRIDLETLRGTLFHTKGKRFEVFQPLRVASGPDGWVVGVASVGITETLAGGTYLVAYASEDGREYYDGDGRDSVEIGALELVPLELWQDSAAAEVDTAAG